MHRSPTTEHPVVGFAAGLAAHGDRIAVISDATEITYTDLADRIDRAAVDLGPRRQLVLIEAANALEPLVAHLAALGHGHVVLLADGTNRSNIDRLVATYRPDVVIGRSSGTWRWERRRDDRGPLDLHPSLALLLSTSGSTGSAKLVRLSHDNVESNASSIATSLGITDRDRATTSLPMQYCYGLSVIHSHLARGAAVVLTESSVVDPCFWDVVRRSGTTMLAGVPYTFDLLDRVGPDHLALPHLRVVTQAGGRLAPHRVRQYAALGERHGWDLVVMYGQTEATARMAYLPPHLTAGRPEAIGVPVPGGSFTIEPLPEIDDPSVGELVYSGPNVMLGYAESAPDLAFGRTVDVLRTGDLARHHADGLYEIVGRRSRFLKIFGLRIDLAEVESRLAEAGFVAHCTGDDRCLVVGLEVPDSSDVERCNAARRAEDLIRSTIGLPPGATTVLALDELPRLANGKPDSVGLQSLAAAAGARRPAAADAATADEGATRRTTDPVGNAFADVLDLRVIDDGATFVDLGGDSLSYVEMSIRLEDALGHLPANWHVLTVTQLRSTLPRRRGLVTWMETGVVLRAAAIALIVSTHTELVELRGGAHVLLVVAGLNFARFQLASGQMWPTVARVVLPSVVWVSALLALDDDHALTNLLFVNNIVGDPVWSPRWHLWFVEVLVQVLVVLAVAFSVPAVRRWERRHPTATPFALLAVAILPVIDQATAVETSRHLARPHLVAWLFALGWASGRSTTALQRALLTLVVAVAAPGFFGQPTRDAIVVVGLLLVVWVPSVPLPRVAVRPIGLLASASLYVYLTHWQVYPALTERWGAVVATLGSLAVGIAVWAVARRIIARLTPRSRRPSARAAQHAGSMPATA
ncbi:MAG: non-ribosomal peptide synthetase [Acidimicrobiia bacterium]|nr:non-ribosomal peptide synthetase [Acidimicrobiia bacterium]